MRSISYYAIKMFDIMHTHGLLGWVKRSYIEIVQISIILLNLVTWLALVMIWVIPKMDLSFGEQDL